MPATTQPSLHPRLPNDILKHILDHIEPYPDEPIPVDRRRFLSVESFDLPPDSPPGSVADIAKFRCVSKQFADLGAPLLFRRVAARFSYKGLDRLEQLATWKHLTVHVRKFSYLVPYFIEDGVDSIDSILTELQRTGVSPESIKKLRGKAVEQQSIKNAQRDVRVLMKAIRSFTSLQFIQLLRVTDADEVRFLDFLQTNEDARNVINLDWTSACSHASSTIGKALLHSNEVPWSRFSSPMLSPASVQFLRVTDSLTTLAERLTCLTLHFDDAEGLDTKMQNLSGLFGEVFRRATGMQAVHLGFPSHHPLTLPLESVFHNVMWEKLLAFGIQGWELSADEIIGLALRHRDKLKGLRLRDVYLTEGSMWKDVLGFLRDEMRQLQWVSLRRIGYAEFFHSPAYAQQFGAEVGDFNAEFDSSDEEDDTAPAAGPSFAAHDNGENDYDNESDDSDDSLSDSQHDSDDEHGPGTHEMDFPHLDSPVTPTSAPWCGCSGHLDSVDALDDNGVQIDNGKRKYWEKWVLRRCPEHGTQ